MLKKGFTLIELLAVIVLISIITLITIPSVKYANKKIAQKNYETKLKVIKASAEEYGEDNKRLIMYNPTTTYNSYPAVVVTIEDLLRNGYLTKDSDIQEDDILDPRDDSSMKNKTITIYIKNSSAYAVIN